jgi:hypothetical protein
MPSRLLLLVSAYSPLLIVLGIRDHNTRQSLTLVAIGLLMAACLPFVIWRALKANEPRSLDDAPFLEVSQNVAAYLVTFILPFVGLSAPSARDLIAFAVFGVFLFAAYLQAEQLALNPWLLLWRRRIYSFGAEGDRNLLISRCRPSPGETITAVRLARSLYYAREERGS